MPFDIPSSWYKMTENGPELDRDKGITNISTEKSYILFIYDINNNIYTSNIAYFTEQEFGEVFMQMGTFSFADANLPEGIMNLLYAEDTDITVVSATSGEQSQFSLAVTYKNTTTVEDIQAQISKFRIEEASL